MKKNKKILSILLSMMMLISLPACTDAQKGNTSGAGTKSMVVLDEKGGVKLSNLSEQDKKQIEKNSRMDYKQVITNIDKSVRNVKSISASYDVTVEPIEGKEKNAAHRNVIKITSEIKYKKGEDKDGKQAAVIDRMYDNMDMDSVKYEDYVDMTNNRIFLKENGSKEFKEYVPPKEDDKSKNDDKKKKDDSTMDVQTESTYVNAVNAFLFAACKGDVKTGKPFFTMQETDTTYDFVFKGENDAFVFMIDGLFGLGMNGLAIGKATPGTEESKADIRYSFSKTDYSMVAVRHTLIQESQGTTYKSEGLFKLTSKDDDSKLVNINKLLELSK